MRFSFLPNYVQHVLFPAGPRWLLLLAVVAATGLGLARGFNLIKEASFDFKAPPNSRAELAELALTHYFPRVAGETAATTILVRSLVGRDVIADPNVVAFEARLEEILAYNFKDALIYVSFRSLRRQGLDYFALNMVNNASLPTAQTIRLGLSRLPYPDFRSKDFADLVDDALRVLISNAHLSKHDYFIASTGPAVFSRDVRETTERDVSFIDGATFPVAMFTLALVLRSFRLLILPVACILSVVAISFLIMYELSQRGWVKVTTLVPSIMMSSAVGFSIDYSLFLLSRFREELRNERTVKEAVSQSVSYAGHTIVVSGLTLAFCWFVLITFPVAIVSSVGIAAGITTTVCIVVNLSLTPCLILSFPDFFSTESAFFSLQEWAQFRKRWVRRARRILRWIFCCGCLRMDSGYWSRNDDGRGEGDHHRIQVDSSPLLSNSVPMDADDVECQQPQPQATFSAAVTSTGVLPTSSSLSASPSASSSSFTTEDASSSIALEERPSSRPPINFIESQDQVATEMRFVEANARRTFKVARFVTSSWEKSFAIVVLLTAFLVPFGYFAWHYDHSDSFLLMIPRSARGTEAYGMMEEEFGRGHLDPYQILVLPPQSLSLGGDSRLLPTSAQPTVSADTSITKQGSFIDLTSMGHLGTVFDSHGSDIFEFVQRRVIHQVLLGQNATLYYPSAPPTHAVATIQSVVWLFNRSISYSEYRRCELPLPVLKSAFCRTLLAAASQSLSKEGALLVRVELAVEPSSGRGQAWLRHTRKALDTIASETGYEFYIAAGASVSLDVVASVYEQFPLAIALTATVVLVLVAVAFQSVVVPLRALFSIAATLCFVYGSAVLVYQHGLLKWMGIAGLTSPTNEIFWVSPIMLFGVLCGISLDYDTFTLIRIVEYHTAGFSETDSVRAGLASSFKVVTTAGFIMTIAFCGLLFSDLPVLNQISFFLCTAVLFDTFVVRMFYVPSLMILLGRFNWFPRSSLARFETQS